MLGANASGNLGNNSNGLTTEPVAVYTSGVISGVGLRMIAVGQDHACSIGDNNKVYCWGSNYYGELGDNTTTDRTVPTETLIGALYFSSCSNGYIYNGTSCVKEYLNNSKISASTNLTCAIDLTKKVYCWGYGGDGEIGNGADLTSLVPLAVDTTGVLSGKTIEKVTVGDSTPCVIANDKKAYCWGYGADGQLGNGGTSNSNIPVAVDMTGVLSGLTLLDIQGGYDFTCVLASDYKPYCWGWNDHGQLGNNSTVGTSTPVAVSIGAHTVKQIMTGYQHACAIRDDDVVVCWGGNAYGELGNGTAVGSSSSLTPTPVYANGVLLGKTIKYIHAHTGAQTCAIADDDLAYCWGDSGNGESGSGTWSPLITPAAVSRAGVMAGISFRSIITGYRNSYALGSDNLLYGWAANGDGQIGDGTTNASSVPVNVNMSGVLSGLDILSMSTGQDHVCVIAQDHNAYCWGSNYYGENGDNSQTGRSLPVLVHGGLKF